MGSRIETTYSKAPVPDVPIKNAVETRVQDGLSTKIPSVSDHLNLSLKAAPQKPSILRQATNRISDAVRLATDIQNPGELFLPFKVSRQLGQMQDAVLEHAVLPHVAKLQQRAGVAITGPAISDAPLSGGQQDLSTHTNTSKGMTSAEKFFWGVTLGGLAGLYGRKDLKTQIAAFGGATYGTIATFWTDEAKGKWDSVAMIKNEVQPSDYVFNAGSSALFAAVLANTQSHMQTGMQGLVRRAGLKLTDDVALVSARSIGWGAENAMAQWVSTGEVDGWRAFFTGVGGGLMTYAKPLGLRVGFPIHKHPTLIMVPVTAIASLVKLVEDKLAGYSFGPKHQKVELGPSGARDPAVDTGGVSDPKVDMPHLKGSGRMLQAGQNEIVDSWLNLYLPPQVTKVHANDADQAK